MMRTKATEQATESAAQKMAQSKSLQATANKNMIDRTVRVIKRMSDSGQIYTTLFVVLLAAEKQNKLAADDRIILEAMRKEISTNVDRIMAEHAETQPEQAA